jgi:amino-acid N-acetyltransferase
MTSLGDAWDPYMNGPHLPLRKAEAATDRDLAAILALLEQAGLPRDDLTTGGDRVRFWVVRDGQRLLGAIGLESFGGAGLLRSLVVAPAAQGVGLGSLLVGTLEAAAVAAGMDQLVLLTLTAEQFFARHGYRVIDRATAPVAMRDATEFRSLCPASAICMSKTIG